MIFVSQDVKDDAVEDVVDADLMYKDVKVKEILEVVVNDNVNDVDVCDQVGKNMDGDINHVVDEDGSGDYSEDELVKGDVDVVLDDGNVDVNGNIDMLVGEAYVDDIGNIEADDDNTDDDK